MLPYPVGSFLGPKMRYFLPNCGEADQFWHPQCVNHTVLAGTPGSLGTENSWLVFIRGKQMISAFPSMSVRSCGTPPRNFRLCKAAAAVPIDAEVPMFAVWRLGRIGRKHFQSFPSISWDGNVMVARLADSAGVNNRPHW